MTHPFLRRALVPITVSLACVPVAAQGLASQYGQIVQAVGDPIAAVPGSVISTTSNFDAPVMDGNGTVLYRARMSGGTVTGVDDRAYFMGRTAGDLRMVVRASDQAPGCPAGTLLRNSSATAGSGGLNGQPRLSPFGEKLFFLSALYDPSNPANTPTTADSALFWGPVGALQLLAREGDPVPFLPGTPAPTWGNQSFSHQNNAINASGQVLFTSAIAGGSVTVDNDTVMVTGTPGNLTIVSREGDVLPTGEVVIPTSGSTMSFINQINELGWVLHEMRFSTTAGTATAANDRALAIWVAGSEIIVAREGQQAPSLPPGVLFATPTQGWTPATGSASFTRSGKTMLLTALDGGGTTTANDTALYVAVLGGTTLVLREGDACPGLGAGELFGVVGNISMSCNEAGEFVFISSLTGPAVTAANDTSIWTGTVGNLTLVAREGDAVPGFAPSPNGPWTYGAMSQGSGSPYLVDGGRVLFQNTITDGVAMRNIWFGYTPQRGIQVMLYDTDAFTTSLGTGAWTVISSTGSFNGGDGGPSWFNNNGDFAIRPNLAGAPTAAIVRGHLGTIYATPSAVSAAAGGTQTFHLDVGPSQAGNLYVVAGNLSGTRPGFDFGAFHVPLNQDLWLDLSVGNANSAVYGNTMRPLDAQGMGTATFNFPPGFLGFVGANFHHAFAVLNSSGFTHISEATGLLIY